jgi:GAF domain-containing protein
VRSFVGAPIYVEDEVIGFINLDSAKPNFFTEAVAQQLQGYANQVALPIRNARLYQMTRRQSELIGQVSSELQRSTAVDDVIESAIRSLNTAFPDYDIRLRLKTSQAPDKADSKTVG